jgi:hypothetical protein
MYWNIEKNIYKVYIIPLLEYEYCLIALNWKSSDWDIWDFHSVVAMLVGRFEQLKTASRWNIPEDQ